MLTRSKAEKEGRRMLTRSKAALLLLASSSAAAGVSSSNPPRPRPIKFEPNKMKKKKKKKNVKKRKRKVSNFDHAKYLISLTGLGRCVDVSEDPCFATITNNNTKKKNNNSIRGGGIDDYEYSSTTIHVTDNNFLVFEILSRLPVKTLVRFKSVCKTWISLIEKDENFINLHFTRSSSSSSYLNKTTTLTTTQQHSPPLPCRRSSLRLLMVVPVPHVDSVHKRVHLGAGRFAECNFTKRSYRELHVTADLLLINNEDDHNTNKIVVEEEDTIRETVLSSYTTISEPVNGLICLVDSQRKYAHRIYNICTRQESPWFISEFVLKLSTIYTRYGFGFDPATNEHKLVCVHNLVGSLPSTKGSVYDSICEVLTIGGRQGNTPRWTTIEKPNFPRFLAKGSICVNGVIYFNTDYLEDWKKGLLRRTDYVCISAFDVGSDKFRRIAIPDFILHHHRTCFGNPICFIQVDGRFAMIIRMNKNLFNMYLYKDDEDRWSELTSFVLPFYLEDDDEVKFHSFLGSDDKVIVINFGQPRHWNDPYSPDKSKCVTSPIYCYNWKNDSLTEFDVSGTLSSVSQPLGFRSSLSTFSESLFPVSNESSTSTPP